MVPALDVERGGIAARARVGYGAGGCRSDGHGPLGIELTMMSGSLEFVERRDESFYLAGTRVPLACIVREFQNGQSPEAIRSAFPTLTLEQVYGAITFYLGHRSEVDEDLAARERVEDTFSETHPAPADLKQKLKRA